MLIAHTERHRDWDAKLPELAFATRTTVNRSTGFTPARLNLGKELTFPLENSYSVDDPGAPRSYGQFAGNLRLRLRDIVRDARESLDVARLQQAEQYNRGHRDVQFHVGDLVLRRTHPLSNAARGFTASLADRWDGPYRHAASQSGCQTVPITTPALATQTLLPAQGTRQPEQPPPPGIQTIAPAVYRLLGHSRQPRTPSGLVVQPRLARPAAPFDG
ncbi:uncharacterized protein LOC120851191 [Ixodes scapularis]|uniref:uncharacterized protein LOC120851191 n=1 Tax=Ixodes scapularis TaxID=6945 RepID=UPI001A9CCABB|nr:uncharacterized protein LOC120851191 [Ixodes scapularis]